MRGLPLPVRTSPRRGRRRGRGRRDVLHAVLNLQLYIATSFKSQFLKLVAAPAGGDARVPADLHPAANGHAAAGSADSMHGCKLYFGYCILEQ